MATSHAAPSTFVSSRESRIQRDRVDFRHNPLLPWVLANRARLVRAALVILRAHVNAGRPSCGVKPWGSFESWSAVVASAVAWVGLPDPQSTRTELASTADTAKQAMRALLVGWERLTADSPDGLTVKEVISSLYPTEQLRGHAAPDGYDDLRFAVEALVPTPTGKAPSPHKLGCQLRSMHRRVIDGRCFDRNLDRTNVVRWFVRSAQSESAA